jgi:hypothetical protein
LRDIRRITKRQTVSLDNIGLSGKAETVRETE